MEALKRASSDGASSTDAYVPKHDYSLQEGQVIHVNIKGKEKKLPRKLSNSDGSAPKLAPPPPGPSQSTTIDQTAAAEEDDDWGEFTSA